MSNIFQRHLDFLMQDCNNLLDELLFGVPILYSKDRHLGLWQQKYEFQNLNGQQLHVFSFMYSAAAIVTHKMLQSEGDFGAGGV